MSKMISGTEYGLFKIFSSDFEFVIPEYQRPYSREEEHARSLFEDLYTFFKTEGEDGYFLGSIVLIKNEVEPHSEVIDGQQRITTLTILLAAIASHLDPELQKNMMDYIIEPGAPLVGIEARPRLSLRERDQKFFNKYIQKLNLNDLMGLDSARLENESQFNIQKNCRTFCSEIESKFGEDRKSLSDFASFVLKKCFLVVVSTPNQNSAYRVFSVMNSRGLDLQTTDIIKADIIGGLPEEKRGEVSNHWEQMEVALGRNGFNDLFSFIRMIYAKEKARKSLLEEFKQHVLSKIHKNDSFVEKILKPYASAYDIIRTNSYEAQKFSGEVNEFLTWLGRLDFSDWVPPAIAFMSRYGEQPDQVFEFFRLLERLSAWMHVCRLYVNERIEIFSTILEEIEANKTAEKIERLKLTQKETDDFINALDGDVYTLTPRRRNYVMLRLDSFISDHAAVYDSKILTIEHVLPQTVEDNSEWAKSWPDVQVRAEWVHRIGNLGLLNKRKNSSAGNYSFKKKCKKYFLGRGNVTSYALTAQVLSYEEWTLEVVQQRQKELLTALKEGWAIG